VDRPCPTNYLQRGRPPVSSTAMDLAVLAGKLTNNSLIQDFRRVWLCALIISACLYSEIPRTRFGIPATTSEYTESAAAGFPPSAAAMNDSADPVLRLGGQPSLDKRRASLRSCGGPVGRRPGDCPVAIHQQSRGARPGGNRFASSRSAAVLVEQMAAAQATARTTAVTACRPRSGRPAGEPTTDQQSRRTR